MRHKKALLFSALVFFSLCAAVVLWPTDAGSGNTQADSLKAESSGLHISIIDSSIKVRPDSRFPRSEQPVIQIVAARNEEESGQFVLYSEAPIADLAVSVSDLRGSGEHTISADNIDVLEAQQVLLSKASDAMGEKGLWPDPLVPLTGSFKLAARKSQGIWLRIKVAADTAPGKYIGNATIKSGPTELARIAIALDVWKATLPQVPTLPSVVGLDYEMIARFEGVDLNSPSFEADLLPRYYRALRRNHVYPLFVHNAKPIYRDDGNGAMLDMTPFWARIEAALGEEKSSAPIGLPFSESWPVSTASFPLMSLEYKRRAKSYLAALARELDKRDALSNSFIYLATSDEPKSDAQIKRIREFAELLHQADPRLRLLQTVHAHCDDCSRDALTQLEHPSLLWAPNIAYFDNKAMHASGVFGSIKSKPSGWTADFSARMKSERRDIWLYFNSWTFLLDNPPAYPTLFIDHEGIEPRVAGWLAYHYDIAGLGHWTATYWRYVSNPWKQLPSGEGGEGTPGDGVLLFPAKDSSNYTGQKDPNGPITTIRLEMMREGAEDHALLTLLKRNGQEALARRLTAQLIRSLADFDRDPVKYRDARRQIAEAMTN